jgi:O-antigen ligase
VIVAMCVVFTQSRGGQLCFAAVLGAYFIRKFGWKRGVFVGALMAAPMLMMGGRAADASAEESTFERLGCAAAGIKMFMSHPISGVGYTQFSEYHFLTAHNAYVLAAAELGVVGMWMFGCMMYLAIRVPLAVLNFEMPADDNSHSIKCVAMALVATFSGGAVGILFLSWTYHYVLWVHFGLSSALFAVVKRRFPAFSVRFPWRERLLIGAGYLAYIVFWAFYIRHKGAWD